MRTIVLVVFGVLSIANLCVCIIEGFLSVALYDQLTAIPWPRLVAPAFLGWLFFGWFLVFVKTKTLFFCMLAFSVVLEGFFASILGVFLVHWGYVDLIRVTYIMWGIAYAMEMIALAVGIGLNIIATFTFSVFGALCTVGVLTYYYGFQPLVFVLAVLIPLKPVWVVYRVLFDTAMGVTEPYKIIKNIYGVLPKNRYTIVTYDNTV